MAFAKWNHMNWNGRNRLFQLWPRVLKLRWKRPALIFVATIWFGFMMGVANTSAPIWKIGRAVIEPRQALSGQRVLNLKLSLRNEGGVGSLPVQIFGRWAIQPMPPQHTFMLLGNYVQEVALKQTAILEIPLTPLRGVPPARPPLEVVVMTGRQETDRKWIKLE